MSHGILNKPRQAATFPCLAAVSALPSGRRSRCDEHGAGVSDDIRGEAAVGHSWHHGERGVFPLRLVFRSLVYAKCRLFLHHQKRICHRGSFHIGHIEWDFTHCFLSMETRFSCQADADHFSPELKVELSVTPFNAIVSLLKSSAATQSKRFIQVFFLTNSHRAP